LKKKRWRHLEGCEALGSDGEDLEVDERGLVRGATLENCKWRHSEIVGEVAAPWI